MQNFFKKLLDRNVYGVYGLFAVLVVLCVIFSAFDSVFLSPRNLLNIIDQISILGVVSLGMLLVILIGGIDLSVGAVVALSGIILGKLLSTEIPIAISLIVCILSGSFIGFLNGTLSTYGKIAPFIATLGVMSATRGIALLISDGKAVSSFQKSIEFLSDRNIILLPITVVILIILFIFFYVFEKYTYWSRYILAIGGNEKAAWLSGVRVKAYKLVVYCISGAMAAIGSIILVSKLNSAQPQAGIMYELDAIAAVVIGGASLSGGKGSVIGTLGGVLIIGVVKNGLSILNVPIYYQQILIGVIIIFAVLVDKINDKQDYEK